LGTQLSVLFDSGATHSFIFVDCVEKYRLPNRELDVELVVSTPTECIIITSFVCTECPVIINGRKYKINMICIHMKDLEVILGIDWLSTSHILIDCCEKKLIFPESESIQVVSAQQIEREAHEGAKCFMFFAYFVNDDKTRKNMVVVQEFMDVFPDEILGLPPKR